jgi:hypothetical protein
MTAVSAEAISIYSQEGPQTYHLLLYYQPYLTKAGLGFFLRIHHGTGAMNCPSFLWCRPKNRNGACTESQQFDHNG